MRIGLIIGFASSWWFAAVCLALEPPQTNREIKYVGPSVPVILREASEIALLQEEHQSSWERILVHIGKVQIQVGDYDGALRSIRGSGYEYMRNAALIDLAEAIARDGKKERAFEVLRLVDSDHGWRQKYMEDRVQLRWIEHLIAAADLDRARKAIEQLKTVEHRPNGLRRLAVGYAKSGDATLAAEHFKLSIDATAQCKDEFDRARAMWETAEAQLSVGTVDAAKATIHRLTETVEFKDPWAKVTALCESAVLAAKAKDEPTARRLFLRAIEAQKDVNAMSKIGALEQIAVAQAGVGYIEDARKTASMMQQDGGRERALYAIAIAQLKGNDTDGAVRTAWSIKDYVQYREDALQMILDHQIVNRDLRTALAMAEKIDNPSRKATAILKVATAHATSGDQRKAKEVAVRIELTHAETLLSNRAKYRFDYRLPRTWGVCYDLGLGFTMSSYFASRRRAADVAAAAITLAIALGQKPAESYAVLFNEVNAEEVTRALARAHAASGDPSEALAWAKQIGSGGKVKSDDDLQIRFAVERRIHALVGVAEGILDRSRPKPGP